MLKSVKRHHPNTIQGKCKLIQHKDALFKSGRNFQQLSVKKKKKKKQDGQEKLKGNSVLKEHGTDELNQVDACPWKQKTLKVKKDMKI